MRTRTSYGVALFALAAALVLNTGLGPLGVDVIDYPISGSLFSQLLGLELVSVGLVAPLAIVAGVSALRGHRLAPLLGFGPAAYSAYMFVQYVLGPEYSTYNGVVLFHLAIFVLSAAVVVWSWSLAVQVPLPELSDRRRRAYGVVVLALAAFIGSRYLPAFSGAATSAPLPAEFEQARTFYWSIFLLDLGVIVPVTVAAGVGILRRSATAGAAVYAVVLWYALVPPSVAAMSTAMVLRDDPNASVLQAVVLTAVSLLFAALVVWIWRPLVRPGRVVPPLGLEPRLEGV